MQAGDRPTRQARRAAWPAGWLLSTALCGLFWCVCVFVRLKPCSILKPRAAVTRIKDSAGPVACRMEWGGGVGGGELVSVGKGSLPPPPTRTPDPSPPRALPPLLVWLLAQALS